MGNSYLKEALGRVSPLASSQARLPFRNCELKSISFTSDTLLEVAAAFGADKGDLLLLIGQKAALGLTWDLFDWLAKSEEIVLPPSPLEFIHQATAYGVDAGYWSKPVTFLLEESLPKYLYVSAEISHPFSERPFDLVADRSTVQFLVVYIRALFNWVSDFYRIVRKRTVPPLFVLQTSQIEEDVKGKVFLHLYASNFYDAKWDMIDEAYFDARSAFFVDLQDDGFVKRLGQAMNQLLELLQAEFSIELSKYKAQIDEASDTVTLRFVLNAIWTEYESLRMKELVARGHLKNNAYINNWEGA